MTSQKPIQIGSDPESSDLSPYDDGIIAEYEAEFGKGSNRDHWPKCPNKPVVNDNDSDAMTEKPYSPHHGPGYESPDDDRNAREEDDSDEKSDFTPSDATDKEDNRGAVGDEDEEDEDTGAQPAPAQTRARSRSSKATAISKTKPDVPKASRAQHKAPKAYDGDNSEDDATRDNVNESNAVTGAARAARAKPTNHEKYQSKYSSRPSISKERKDEQVEISAQGILDSLYNVIDHTCELRRVVAAYIHDHLPPQMVDTPDGPQEISEVLENDTRLVMNRVTLDRVRESQKQKKSVKRRDSKIPAREGNSRDSDSDDNDDGDHQDLPAPKRPTKSKANGKRGAENKMKAKSKSQSRKSKEHLVTYSDSEDSGALKPAIRQATPATPASQTKARKRKISRDGKEGEEKQDDSERPRKARRGNGRK